MESGTKIEIADLLHVLAVLVHQVELSVVDVDGVGGDIAVAIRSENNSTAGNGARAKIVDRMSQPASSILPRQCSASWVRFPLSHAFIWGEFSMSQLHKFVRLQV